MDSPNCQIGNELVVIGIVVEQIIAGWGEIYKNIYI